MTDQLALANSVHWYIHGVKRVDGHVLRRALDFEFEAQRKGDQKETGCKKIHKRWCENGRCTLPIKVYFWHNFGCHYVQVNVNTLNCL